MSERYVTFLPAQKSILATPGTRIMDLARIVNVPIPFRCGGKGRCGRCLVFIREGQEALGPLTEAEAGLLSAEDIQGGGAARMRSLDPRCR